MELEQVRYEILLEAASPIAQSEGTIGNASVAMTRKVRQPDGAFARVPIVTGDALRHKLREAGAYALLEAAGLLDAAGPALSEAAVRLLFAGGMLTGRGDASVVKLAEVRALVAALPHLALLGGCANNHMLAGQLAVGDALLVCEETRHVVPAWMLDRVGALETCRAHVEEEQRVRFDPLLDRRARALLAPAAAAAIEARLDARERAHDDDDARARAAAKSTMLPRTAEVVVAGACFAWEVTATTYSALERDTFVTLVGTFLANAVVGGKTGTGHGRLRAVAGNRVALARPREQAAAMDLATLGPGGAAGHLFRAHVRDHAAAVRAALAAVDA